MNEEKPRSTWQKSLKMLKKACFNKYGLVILFFMLWMVFFDNTSVLVINEINNEINKYESQKAYYKAEYEKNNGFYKKLMNNKAEREKFARENYFMKKSNEQIFIMVVDSGQANTQP
jgi:cell division protein FtsB